MHIMFNGMPIDPQMIKHFQKIGSEVNVEGGLQSMPANTNIIICWKMEMSGDIVAAIIENIEEFNILRKKDSANVFYIKQEGRIEHPHKYAA